MPYFVDSNALTWEIGDAGESPYPGETVIEGENVITLDDDGGITGEYDLHPSLDSVARAIAPNDIHRGEDMLAAVDRPGM